MNAISCHEADAHLASETHYLGWRAEQALGHGSTFSKATIEVVQVLSGAKRVGFE